MIIDLNKTITIQALIEFARNLRSEDGENREYDRALLELITDAATIPQTERTPIAWMIGVNDFMHG